MKFGEALDALSDGARVARAGWNGAGQWLILVPGSTITVDADRPLGQAAPELVGRQIRYAPHVDIYATGGRLFPWTPSQSDQLADDWMVVHAGEPGPVTFTLNTKPCTLMPPSVSYEELANLAGIDPQRRPTIVYRRAAGAKPDGILVPGETVHVTDRTVIDVAVTGSA